MNELESKIRRLANKIEKKHGYSDKYEIVLSETLPDDIDIQMIAGNPVNIHINLSFILVCFEQKKMVRLIDRLDRALDKIPLSLRWLGNLNPPIAIVLCSDSKRWLKSFAPIVKKKEIVHWYSVTVMDEESGVKINYTSDSPDKLEALKIKAQARVEFILAKDEIPIPIERAQKEYNTISFTSTSDERNNETIVTKYD